MESNIKSFEDSMLETFGQEWASLFDNNSLMLASFCYEQGKANTLVYVMQNINKLEKAE